MHVSQSTSHSIPLLGMHHPSPADAPAAGAPATMASAPSLCASLSAAVRRGLAESPALSALQQHTTCNICYDSLSSAMSLPCLHSFCSLCVRRCLYLNASCPLCHAPASSGELRANFQLTQLSGLVASLQGDVAEVVEASVREWARVHVPAVAAEEEAQAAAEAAAAASAAAHAAAASESKASDSNGSLGSPAASSSSRSAAKERTNLPSKVECPCCGLQIVATRINSHLDACLGKEENRAAASAATVAATSAVATVAPAASSSSSSSSSSNAASLSARLPFPVYGMLTDKQLRKLVSEAGFPVGSGAASGGLAQDRDSLIRRHRELVLRHNSEMDAAAASGGAVAPQSDQMLVREIVRKEKALNNSQSGKHKQILLSAFAAGAASSAHDSSHNHVHSAEQSSFSVALSGGGHGSNHSHSHNHGSGPSTRKRSKVDETPSGSTRFLASRTAASSSAPAILDLCDDSPPPPPPPPSSRSTTESTSHAQEASAASSVAGQAAETVPSATASSAPQHPAASSSFSSAAASATAPSCLDPWAALVTQYESRHGRRKRWRRAWGVDPQLYPAVECIDVEAEEEANDAGAAGGATAANAPASSSGAAVSPSVAGSKTPKPVFSLFQPSGSASHSSEPVSPAAAAVPPTSASTPIPAPTKSSSSASAQIRVSKVLCASCHSVCRGSFPLGAQVVCPKCRPNWTTIAARQQRREEEDATPAADVKVGWLLQAQLAQQAQQAQQQAAQQSIHSHQHQPLQHHSLSAPVASSSTSSPSAALPNGNGGGGSGSPVLTLSAEQRNAIEARRIAALSKLRRDKTGSSTPPVGDTSTAAPAPEVLAGTPLALHAQAPESKEEQTQASASAAAASTSMDTG